MIEGLTYQAVLFVLLGVAVFVLGTTNMKRCLKARLTGEVLGKVLKVDCVEKRDENGRLIQHYYDVRAQYKEEGRNRHSVVRTTREYGVGDPIRLMRQGSRLLHMKQEPLSLFVSVQIALTGMMMAVFPVAYNQMGQWYGSAVLSLVLFLAGCIALSSYVRDRKRRLLRMNGEIEDVLYYVKAKKKRFVPASEQYYPLIRYELRGVQRLFLGSGGASQQSRYKKGARVQLFYDEDMDMPVEKRLGIGLIVLVVLLWGMALVGLISLFGMK